MVRFKTMGLATNHLNNDFFDSDIPGDMGFEERNLNFPIPNNETDANPNITQN